MFFTLSPSFFSLSLFSPWRIMEDCGAAFAMGCIGGGVFSFWKGYRNSPVVCVCVCECVCVGGGYICVCVICIHNIIPLLFNIFLRNHTNIHI